MNMTAADIKHGIPVLPIPAFPTISWNPEVILSRPAPRLHGESASQAAVREKYSYMMRKTEAARSSIASREYLTKPDTERAAKWLMTSTAIGRYHKTSFTISTAREGAISVPVSAP